MTVSWPQARRLAHAAAAGRAAEPVALSAALGRVLAGPLRALVDLPGVDTLAMDGWAVCGTGPWRVVGTSPAGAPRSALAFGEAVEVATGTQLPVGATGVVRVEDGAVAEGRLSGPVRHGDVRRRGEQCRAGEVVLPAGTTVTPPALGLAAAVGVDQLAVLARPRVAAVVLGDEVVSTGLPAAGQVRDAVGPQLPGWVAAFGGEWLGLTRAPDDLPSTCAALGVAADVVVVSGGTSVGRGDFLRSALAALGATPVIDGVAVRPGHPMMLARLPSGTLVLGLPGNPLAAVVALLTLLGPLLAGMLGRELAGLPGLAELPGLSGTGLAPPAQGVTLLPGRLRAGVLEPAGHGGSAMLRGAAGADGLVAVHADGSVQWLAFPW